MKKILTKALFLSFALLLLLIPLASCDGEEEATEGASETEQTEAPTDAPAVPEAIVGNELIIFENGAYNIRIVCSDAATDFEKQIYNEIRSKLRTLTGVNPEFSTDFLAFNDSGEERKAPAILIGRTNYDESAAVYGELNYGTGIMRLEGNKLVLAFSAIEEGEALYGRLESLLATATAEKVSLDLSSLPVTEVSNEAIADIPVFPGKEYATVDTDDGTYFLRIAEASFEDFEAYKQMIADSGYTLADTRTAGQLNFATFLRGEEYLYVYHKPSSQTIRAIVGPVDHLAPLPTGETVEQIAEPSLTLVGQAYSDIGLGMIYRLPDGKFVIFDGGANYSRDLVYKALESQKVTEDITIAAWFLTHPHGDHHGGFLELLDKHTDDVTIENLVFNFASAESYHVPEKDNNAMTEIREILKNELPDTHFIKPHTGQVLEFSGVQFEIMYTPEDYFPKDFQFLNDSSLIVRANFCDKTILMLADATYEAGAVMIEAYRDYLKSDMVQLAHHGIWASIDKLYGYVDAEVLVWPSNTTGAKDWITDAAVLAALAPARDVHIPGAKTTTIKFPYEFLDNKEDVLADLRALKEQEESEGETE